MRKINLFHSALLTNQIYPPLDCVEMYVRLYGVGCQVCNIGILISFSLNVSEKILFYFSTQIFTFVHIHFPSFGYLQTQLHTLSLWPARESSSLPCPPIRAHVYCRPMICLHDPSWTNNSSCNILPPPHIFSSP